MANALRSLRDYARGVISESTMKENMEPDSNYDFENDEEFMQECMNACIPSILQSMIMDESAEDLDEDVKDAFLKVQNYMIGQGMISESASVNLNNPKITVVRMGKEAQIKRNTTIIALKMARRDKMKAYTKYKLGQKIKKANLGEILRRYGDKAERLARKLWANAKKSGKINSVVDSKKQQHKK